MQVSPIEYDVNCARSVSARDYDALANRNSSESLERPKCRWTWTQRSALPTRNSHPVNPHALAHLPLSQSEQLPKDRHVARARSA